MDLPNIIQSRCKKLTVCFGALLDLNSDRICLENYDLNRFFLFGDVLNELRNDFSVELVKIGGAKRFQLFPVFLPVIEFSENFSAGEVIEVGEGRQT